MTEREWLACADVESALRHLASVGQESERKLRLFSVACCRRLLCVVTVRPVSELAVEVAERYADGNATDGELNEVCCYANNVAEHACRDIAEREPGWMRADGTAMNAAWAIAQNSSLPPDHDGRSPIFQAKVQAEQANQCQVLRDIFGNPFRPIALDPSWLTSDVLLLARGIYDDRAFDRMPILADALQDAGCTNDEVLNHCRDTSLTHVRGCWVVDLVLGKE